MKYNIEIIILNIWSLFSFYGDLRFLIVTSKNLQNTIETRAGTINSRPYGKFDSSFTVFSLYVFYIGTV